MPIERIPDYFITNVVIPLFIIVGLAFVSFALPLTQLNDRLSVILTMVLTSVAFKYVVAGYLPKVSYLTLLDKYVLISFVVLGITAVQNAIVFRKSMDDDVDMDALERGDRVFVSVIAGIWIIVNLSILAGSKTQFFFHTWQQVRANAARLQKLKDDSYKYSPEDTKLPRFE